MATYGRVSKLYIIQIHFYLFFRFTDKVRVTKIEQSDVAMYGGIIYVYIYLCIRFDQPTVAEYGGIYKLYIIQICFYLLFCFTVKVRGAKIEQSDVATYGGIIHVYILLRV